MTKDSLYDFGVTRICDLEEKKKELEPLMAHLFTDGKEEPPPEPKVIFFCLPGESFASTWVANWTALFADLTHEFRVLPFFAWSSNVYVTRNLLQSMCAKAEAKPDWIVWLDDDNFCLPKHVRRLMELCEEKGADAACGWCATENQDLLVSCGQFSPEKPEEWRCATFAEEDMKGLMDAKEPVRIDWTGFPLVCFRGSSFLAMEGNAFSPIQEGVEGNSEWGVRGEDISFWIRAARLGWSLWLEPAIVLPHLKRLALWPFARKKEKKDAS